ncbi:hypothetical protein AVEN_215008-1, partial [Araneus ventricosus]
MKGTTPEPAPPFQASAQHQREGVWPLRSAVELGFEPGTLLCRSRDLTTRPPQTPERQR